MMAAHVACETSNIRVGTGGVMLTHYSPFKVAETFRMLEALHPGRIDLGIGRAPGGNALTQEAIAAPRQVIPHEYYSQQSAELIGYLRGTLSAQHPYYSIPVEPVNGGAPEFWMLGSSGGSSELAGELGASFALALFIGTHERSSAIIDAYRQAFKASTDNEQPKSLIAVAAITADSKEEAEYIASSHVYWKVQAFRLGQRDPLYPPEQALDLKKKLSLSNQAYFDETMNTYILGTAENCVNEISSLAEDYDVDEVMIVNVTHGFEARKRTYTELANQFL
jgi:luciferase family oxidoreductase group 1